MPGSSTPRNKTDAPASCRSYPVIMAEPHIAVIPSMKAYRYFNSHWFESLRDKRFKLAKPSDLNDPFDCVIGYRGKPSTAFVLPGAKQILEKQEQQEVEAGLLPGEIKRSHKSRLTVQNDP